MKQLLRLACAAMATVMVISGKAQNQYDKYAIVKQSVSFSQKSDRAAAETNITLTKQVAALYTPEADGLAEYYLVLADKQDVTLDMSTGQYTAKDAYVGLLDLTAPQNDTRSLPEGTYTATEGGESMTYAAQYSGSAYFDANGKQQPGKGVQGNVTVKKNADGTYTISMTNVDGTSFTYTGRIVFTSTDTHVFPQIGADVNATFTGGLAFYHGNLYQNKLGNIYINLYDTTFDAETGGMTAKGFNFALCAFNRLFPDPSKATVVPGVYQIATSLKNETMYPGIEMEAYGVTIPFGTYVKRRKALTGGDADYDYAYVKSGTVTITQGSASGKFNVTVDCVSDEGFVIKGTGKDIEFPVIDLSDDKTNSAVSNLDHDVALDIDYIKTARVYDLGIQAGCRVFDVDLGSPSGKDGNEGDLLRMEFLADPSARYLPTGKYDVMEYNHLFTNMYEPYKLVQGYFTNDGELTGTRYWHFKDGSYQVVDSFAAVVSGTVEVQKVAETGDYQFTVNLADGNMYYIKGQWSGPMELNYNPSGISSTASEDKKVPLRYEGDNVVELSGVDKNDLVNVFSAAGKRVFNGKGLDKIYVGGLSRGVYIVKVGNKEPVKFIK